MNWIDVIKKDLQRMGLTWEGLKHQRKTDIRGVNVWPYASVMRDESRSRSRYASFVFSIIYASCATVAVLVTTLINPSALLNWIRFDLINSVPS